jgi:hypothetical protein
LASTASVCDTRAKRASILATGPISAPFESDAERLYPLDDDTTRPPVYGAALDVARSLYRRVALGHQGRSDGRRRQPVPIPVDGVVTTPTRNMLASRFTKKVGEVRMTCGKAIDEGEEVLRRLRYDDRDIEQRLEDVRGRLERAERERPSRTGPPEREPGDRHHDEAMARTRRTREHARRIAELSEERKQLEQRLREIGRKREEIIARNETLRRKAVESEQRYAAVFVHERAVYDRALLRRHPLGDLVGPLLDNRIPRLEVWRHALAGGDRRAGG